MQIDSISIVFYETMKTIAILSLPILMSIFFIGLCMSFLQTITQIQEPTLSFIPKILIVFVVFFFFGSWMITILMEYMIHILKIIPLIIFYYIR